MICSVCYGTQFEDNKILWDSLCNEWQIGPIERKYIDRQQGTCCTGCGSNLRSIALASGILKATRSNGSFKEWIKGPKSVHMRVLELNYAGNLWPFLSQMPGHRIGHYPEVNMHSLPYEDTMFDIVVHSDTLEHVPNPIHALCECRRVLKPGGILAFTVPVIVGRLSRDRTGMAQSYHGSSDTAAADFAVVTEYGADMWTHVIQAGFQTVTIHTIDFPSAIAITAER